VCSSELNLPASAALSIPIGKALIDTGCTFSLIGLTTLGLLVSAIRAASHDLVRVRPWPEVVLATFRGIGGLKKALRGVQIPIPLAGGEVVFVNTQVIEGDAPFLVGMDALHAWGAVLDTGRHRIYLPALGGWIELPEGPGGHMLLSAVAFPPGRPPHGVRSNVAARTNYAAYCRELYDDRSPGGNVQASSAAMPPITPPPVTETPAAVPSAAQAATVTAPPGLDAVSASGARRNCLRALRGAPGPGRPERTPRQAQLEAAVGRLLRNSGRVPADRMQDVAVVQRAARYKDRRPVCLVLVKPSPKFYQQPAKEHGLHPAQGISRCTLAIYEGSQVSVLEPYALLGSVSTQLPQTEGQGPPLLTVTMFSHKVDVEPLAQDGPAESPSPAASVSPRHVDPAHDHPRGGDHDSANGAALSPQKPLSGGNGKKHYLLGVSELQAADPRDPAGLRRSGVLPAASMRCRARADGGSRAGDDHGRGAGTTEQTTTGANTAVSIPGPAAPRAAPRWATRLRRGRHRHGGSGTGPAPEGESTTARSEDSGGLPPSTDRRGHGPDASARGPAGTTGTIGDVSGGLGHDRTSSHDSRKHECVAAAVGERRLSRNKLHVRFRPDGVQFVRPGQSASCPDRSCSRSEQSGTDQSPGRAPS